MVDYAGRNLAWVRDTLHLHGSEWRAESVNKWLEKNDARLMPVINDDLRSLPLHIVLFWENGLYGYCAISVGDNKIIDPVNGIIDWRTPHHHWSFRFKGWIQP